MPDYAELTETPPVIFTRDHYASWDQAMQQVAIANAIISACEQADLPVTEARTECDGLCTFFNRLNQQFRGPQAAQPEVRE